MLAAQTAPSSDVDQRTDRAQLESRGISTPAQTAALDSFHPAGRLRSTLYGFLLRGGRLLHRAGNACGYLAAGLLRQSDLHLALQRQFRGFGIPHRSVEEGLTPFERRLYDRWVQPAGRILVIGCGAGRDLIALQRLGYQPTGLEQAPDLVEAAKEHFRRLGIDAPIRLGLAESTPLDTQYDAIVFSGSSYSNVHPAATRVATLQRLRSRLLPGGRFLVEYLESPSQPRWPAALARFSARLAAADWRPEAGDTFTLDAKQPGVLDFAHYFRPGEVAEECRAAGLRMVADEAASTHLHSIIAQTAD